MPILHFIQTQYLALKNNSVSTSESYILMQHRSKLIATKKPNYKQKIWAKRKKWLKTVIYASFSQKHFSKSKSHLLNAAHDQITSLAEKKVSSHCSFTHFRF